MAIVATRTGQQMIGRLAFHQTIVMAGNARTLHPCMVELTDNPGRCFMAFGAFASRPVVEGSQSFGHVRAMAGEAAGTQITVINIDSTPLRGNVAISADRTGLGMICGLAARHGAIVALRASRRYTLENRTGMASFTGDIGVCTFKRKISCAMIEVTVNLDAAIDFFGKCHGTDAEKHSEPNRDCFRRVEQ